MCNLCDRQFKNKAALRNHAKDSPKHRTPPNAPRSISSNVAKAPASSLNCEEAIVTEPEPEPEAGRTSTKENDNIGEPLTDFEDEPCVLSLPRLGLHTPQTSFLNGDPDIDIGTAYGFSVSLWVIPFFKTDPDEANTYNPFGPVSVEHQEKNTNSGSYELVIPEVPAPWSPILLSERDVVLNALQAQCHPIDCLAGERYWTQTPSPVDIDMTRQCSDCGGKGSP